VLAAKGDKRFRSASFMVSLQDFERVGDTAVFMDEEGLELIERQMLERGYLDSSEMSNMFNLLRSNDLIWANVVNNYLLGNKPPAFDLLYWNSDGTRMTRAAHSWYLRNTYGENNLVKPGKIKLKGEGVDLGRITLDSYSVGPRRTTSCPGTRHGASRSSSAATCGSCSPRAAISPASSTRRGAREPIGRGRSRRPPAARSNGWRKRARHDGSWWPDWAAWLAARSGKKGKPPAMGSDDHPPLEDAPGSYVLEK
jgi:polyhydroxyalkanoate synthase subunit PhaC